jgi:hypothetical protein
MSPSEDGGRFRSVLQDLPLIYPYKLNVNFSQKITIIYYSFKFRGILQCFNW